MVDFEGRKEFAAPREHPPKRSVWLFSLFSRLSILYVVREAWVIIMYSTFFFSILSDYGSYREISYELSHLFRFSDKKIPLRTEISQSSK